MSATYLCIERTRQTDIKESPWTGHLPRVVSLTHGVPADVEAVSQKSTLTVPYREQSPETTECMPGNKIIKHHLKGT